MGVDFNPSAVTIPCFIFNIISIPLIVGNVGSRTRDRSKVKPGLVEKDIRSSRSDHLQPGKKEVFQISVQPRGKTKKSSVLHLTSTK
jgi:hypothetical protein